MSKKLIKTQILKMFIAFFITPENTPKVRLSRQYRLYKNYIPFINNLSTKYY